MNNASPLFLFLLQSLFLLFLLLQLQLDLGVFGVVIRRHVQPLMIKHGFGTGSLFRVPVKHGQQEVGECLGFLWLELVFLFEHLVEWPVVEASDAS